MANKPFAIQGADLTLGGVNLQAGRDAVVIPGLTQAVNYIVEDVNEFGNDNNQDLGSDENAVTVIDNSRYLYLVNDGDTPSDSYLFAEYSVEELDDGNIEEINIETEGVFAAGDKNRAEADNMWATLTPDPFVSFNSANWVQVPFRPKFRAGVVENIGGGGGDTGDVAFDGSEIFPDDDGNELLLSSYSSGLTNDTKSEVRLDANDGIAVLRTLEHFERDFTPGDDGGHTATWTSTTLTISMLPNRNIYLRSMLDRMRRHFDNSADTAFKHDYRNITVVIGREGQGQPITATVTDIESDFAAPPTFTVTLNQSAPSSVVISSIAFEYDYFNTMGFNSSTNDDEDGGDYGAAIDHKNFVITSGRDIDLLATDDINIEAGSTFDLTLRKEGTESDGINIKLTSDTDSNKEWTFKFNGALKFPDETRQFSAYPGEHGQLNVNAYKGFKAIYGRMYADEPTISKVLIYQATATPTSEIDVSTEDDLFKVTGLNSSGVIALLNVYGADSDYPERLYALRKFVEKVIDTVILDGEVVNSVANMKNAFYSNFNLIASQVPDRYENFEFWREDWENISAGTVREGSGAEFTIDKTAGNAGTTFTPSSYGDVTALSVVKDGAGFKYISAQKFAWAVPADYDTFEALPSGTVFTVVLTGGTYTFTTTSKGGTSGTDVSWNGEFSPAISGTVFEAPSSITFGNTPGTYSVTAITAGGTNYLPGHKIKVSGAIFGGASPANDCIITVDAVTGGLIDEVTVTGASTGTANTYNSVSGTNYNVGSGATFDLYRDEDKLVDNIIDNDIDVRGTNYVEGDVITILGEDVNGTTPANNVVITVTEVGLSGDIQEYTYTGNLPLTAWPLNSIDDGGADQYDNANYIYTNIQGDSYDDGPVADGEWAVPYNGGNTADGDEWFGTDSNYVMTYQDGIFGLFVKDASINWIATNGGSGFDGNGEADTGSLFQPVDPIDSIGTGDELLTVNSDGSVTFPDGSIQTTAYTGTAGDANVWVQTFESVEGAPDDVVATAVSVEYDSAGNLICLFNHYLDLTFMGPDNGSYFSVAKISTTGTILWQKRFGSGFRTDGWGLAVDNDAGFIYIAGTDLPDNEANWDNAMLTKIDLADGDLVWSKIYQVVGLDAQSPIVDVASDGNPVMVGHLEDGSGNYIATTKVDSTDGSVIWSRKFDGQGFDNAYGMGVGPNGEVVTVGDIDQWTDVLESYSATPTTGSDVGVFVINRSILSGATFTDSWKVSGVGIDGYADISFINKYSGLTGTVREGTGATFNITIAGDGSITNPVTIANGGSNYLVGHKIKIPYTAIGGADLNSDIILTVTEVSSGSIIAVAAGFYGGGAGTPNTYGGVAGTNYQTGSGLTFDLELDSGSTYTEHPANITAGGTNYVTGDVVVIPGTQLGGTSPANDLTATVLADTGAVTQFNTFSGTQQTTTYRIIVAGSLVDFGADGTWTLSDIDVDQNDRMLVIKYNSSGAIQWQKAIQFDNNYSCQGADCDIDSAGNIYVTGQYDKTDEDGVALSILKLNSSGVAQWSRRVTGNCDTFGASIVVGADDNLYLSGMTAILNPDFPDSGSPYADTHSVLAKYSTAGAVLWQRLLENSSTWSFTGALFEIGTSNLAVKDGYVAVSGGYGDFDNSANISASVAQVSADGTVFSVGEWDFVAANFSGIFFDNASDLTVVDAGKIDSDFSGDITVVDGADMDSGGSDFLIGTVYREGGSADKLVKGANELVLESTGTVTLPKGGTISEGIVTSNPTIQLTPASPDVASQKLVIKGGQAFNNSRSENGITIGLSDIDAMVGETITVDILSGTRANQLLYWWLYPDGVGVGDSDFGTVILDGNGYGDFDIFIDSDDYEFTVRVSPENNNYDPDNVGVESLTINGEAPAYASPYHLHLTTGDLSETSIFLGTDDHNVRTTVDGGIQVTTQTTYVEPNEIIITGADVSAINTTYVRAPMNPPTWTDTIGIGQDTPYIRFVDGEWGIFAPAIDLVLPIYINTGTLTTPLAQWIISPPYGSAAPTGVYIYGTPPVQEWKFGVDGALTLPSDGVIQSSDAFGSIKTVVAVPHTEDRDSGDWDTATYSVHGEGNGKIVFVDPSPSFRQYLTQRLPDSVSTTVTVNGNISLTYTSNNIESTQITLYVNEAPATNPTTITGIVINTVAENRMVIASSNGSMEFVSGNGLSVNIESKLEGDVNIRAGDDIVIQAGDRFRSDSNGGDIDINAGRGGDADHDDSGGDGGDLDIIAGRGGDASADYSAGGGGVTTIRAGRGGDANPGVSARAAGQGANLNLYAGAGGFNGEDVALGNDGGNVNIYAGASTNNGTGGAIVLQAGASGGTGGSGSITLRTETTGNVDRDWVFNNAGTLTLPLGGTIAESVGTTSFVGGVTLTVADVASFAVPGFPAATVNALAGSFTNDGFQYIQFGDWDVTAIQALVTDAGGSSSAVLPITWGAGSTALTGYVLVQITDASTFQMCPVVDADGGSNTPVSGTWFFTANIGNGIAVVGTDTIDLTVGTHTWAFGADGDIVNDEGESFLKDIPQNFPTGYDEGFYALQASDRGRHILIDGTEGFSIMVPTDATDLMPIGSAIVLVIKPGEYSIVVGPEDSDAMTIHGAGVSSVGYYELNAGNGGAMATLVKIGANEWMISGTGLAEWEGP